MVRNDGLDWVPMHYKVLPRPAPRAPRPAPRAPRPAPRAPRPAPRARPHPPHRTTRLNSTWGAPRAHWGGPTPFVSVDGAWCYHWQMCCEVDAEGRSHMCS